MKKFALSFFLLLSQILLAEKPLIFHPQANKDNRLKRVTHHADGRLGDQLLGYLHGKWISYRYGIPFLYKPFSYSDQFVLHENEVLYSTEAHLFPHVITPRFGDTINYDSYSPGTLFDIRYFSESPHELLIWGYQWYTFSVDWKDPIFRKEMQRLIKPRFPIPFHKIPPDRVSVALHMRLGGGYDPARTWAIYPAKFPPHSYYIEQLRTLHTLFNKKPLYVHLFTDDQDPLKIIRTYQKQLSDLDIQFSCREQNNHHTKNVVEDFFAQMQYDCLIRPDSNFSLVAGKIIDYKVIISPIHCSEQNGHVHIDKVLIEKSDEFLQMEKAWRNNL